jgi:outer membrane lipoprotein-sorting protein
MKRFFTLLLIILHFGTKAQDANDILTKVVTKLNNVKDYTVTATVNANIPMIKILPSKATIYFKQKDKFKVVSKGIVILPKQGFSEINTLLANQKSYLAVLGETSKVSDETTYLITIIPNGEQNDIVLAKLWIDTKRSVIMKSQITTKSNGSITSTYSYGDNVNFGLPSQMIFEIDIKAFKLPKSVAADINKSSNVKKTKSSNKGKITISLTDYKVNKGLSDAIFTKNKENGKSN